MRDTQETTGVHIERYVELRRDGEMVKTKAALNTCRLSCHKPQLQHRMPRGAHNSAQIV